MNVHLNILIGKKGELYRDELFVGRFTEQQLKEREDLQRSFKHGTDDESEDYVFCWYTASLEDHEREEIANRKTQQH